MLSLEIRRRNHHLDYWESFQGVYRHGAKSDHDMLALSSGPSQLFNVVPVSACNIGKGPGDEASDIHEIDTLFNN